MSAQARVDNGRLLSSHRASTPDLGPHRLICSRKCRETQIVLNRSAAEDRSCHAPLLVQLLCAMYLIIEYGSSKRERIGQSQVSERYDDRIPGSFGPDMAGDAAFIAWRERATLAFRLAWVGEGVGSDPHPILLLASPARGEARATAVAQSAQGPSTSDDAHPSYSPLAISHSLLRESRSPDPTLPSAPA